MNSPVPYDVRYESEEREYSEGMYNSIIQRTSGGASRNNYRVKKPPVQLRTFFPENWLFSIQETADGTINK